MAKQHYFFKLIPPRPTFMQDMGDEERHLMDEHGRYFQEHFAAGKVLLFGPVMASTGADRVTCRCGIMFFRDTGLVLSEVLRVLKPAGRAAFLVWDSFEQPFFDATVGIVLRLVEGAQMPTQAREMFRFAAPDSLGRSLIAAGFDNGREESFTVPESGQGPEELWAYQQEISTLCHPLFESIPADVRSKIDAEVSTLVSRFRSGSVLSVPVNIIVVSGQRA